MTRPVASQRPPSERSASVRRLLAATAQGDHAAIRLRTLGTFRVVRAGLTVDVGAWQSKKARDVLKILVSRRGLPVPREVLIEALWPDADGDVGNRLSVALTTLRTVLDPSRLLPQDRFVAADRETVAIRLDHVSVDVEQFLVLVLRGDRSYRLGRVREATDAWTRAEARYGGDFLDGDRLDVAGPLREEARSAFVSTARRLADVAVERGDIPAATRHLMRVLGSDPYDEDAHVALVACLRRAGAPGEAERWYQTYEDRMRQLGLAAAPYDALNRWRAAS